MCTPRTFPLAWCLALFASALLCSTTLHAQSRKAGYLQEAYTFFTQPDGHPAGMLTADTFIRLQAVPGHKGWYAALESDRSDTVGFLLNPVLKASCLGEPALAEDAAHDEGHLVPVSSAERGGDAVDERYCYVHRFTNVRAAPTLEGENVAQLPPGAKVRIAEHEGDWALVFKPEGVELEGMEQQRTGTPLGYVWVGLLRPDPPLAEQTTQVYTTRTGTKYHRHTCRYLHESRITMSLREAVEKGYDPCKVCKPPKME